MALADAGNVLLTEEEVMRTYLTRDGQTLLLGNADYSNLEKGQVMVRKKELEAIQYGLFHRYGYRAKPRSFDVGINPTP